MPVQKVVSFELSLTEKKAVEDIVFSTAHQWLLLLYFTPGFRWTYIASSVVACVLKIFEALLKGRKQTWTAAHIARAAPRGNIGVISSDDEDLILGLVVVPSLASHHITQHPASMPTYN